jgi:hypothetical protein
MLLAEELFPSNLARSLTHMRALHFVLMNREEKNIFHNPISEFIEVSREAVGKATIVRRKKAQ